MQIEADFALSLLAQKDVFLLLQTKCNNMKKDKSRVMKNTKSIPHLLPKR